jgi:predicted CopG family antitoxin
MAERWMTIRVSRKVYERLVQLGRKNESFSEILDRLLCKSEEQRVEGRS